MPHIPATPAFSNPLAPCHTRGAYAGCARRHRGQCAAPTHGACSMCPSPRTRRQLSAHTASLRSGEVHMDSVHMGSCQAGQAGALPVPSHASGASTAKECMGLQVSCKGVRLSCFSSLSAGRPLLRSGTHTDMATSKPGHKQARALAVKHEFADFVSSFLAGTTRTSAGPQRPGALWTSSTRTRC
jgi:hypothetical protein